MNGTMKKINSIKASLHPQKSGRDAVHRGGSPAADVSPQHAGIVVDTWNVVCNPGIVADEMKVFCSHVL